MDSNEIKEVRLETKNIDKSYKLNSNKISGNLFNAESLSFESFMGNQLDFISSNPPANTYSASAEIKTTFKDNSKTTSDNKTTSADSMQKTELKNINENNKSCYFVEDDLPKLYLKIDSKDISASDMDQINYILNNPNFSININQINGFNNFSINYNGTEVSYKSFDFSQNLSKMISEGYKTNKPIRIDFENSASVILKIDKDGKLSAQFMSSDKAMEMLLKDNLYYLRAKLDKEGLPYKELSYNDQSGNNNERESNKDK